MALQRYTLNLLYSLSKFKKKKQCNFENIDNCSEIFVEVDTKIYFKNLEKNLKMKKAVPKLCFFLCLFPLILDSFTSN